MYFGGGGHLARYHQTYGREARTIHLPLVDRVEAFQTHIYPLYVQLPTIMDRVDGVGVFGGGGHSQINNMANSLQPHDTHILCN